MPPHDLVHIFLRQTVGRCPGRFQLVSLGGTEFFPTFGQSFELPDAEIVPQFDGSLVADMVLMLVVTTIPFEGRDRLSRSKGRQANHRDAEKIETHPQDRVLPQGSAFDF